MKTKLFLLVVACLLLFATVGQAQRLSLSFSIGPPREGEDFGQSNKYPGLLQLVEKNLKISVRSFWEGGTVRMADELLGDPDIRRAWGVSPDQYQQMMKAWENVDVASKNDPELQRLQVLMNDADVSGMIIRGFDEELLAIAYAQGRRSDELMTIRLSNAFDNTLTPEQRQTMNEAFLASMSELPIILPDMYEALDLTDAQKRQMEKIKNELDVEFEKTLDDFVTYQMMLRDMLIDELDKQGVGAVKVGISPQEMAQEMETVYSEFSKKSQAAMRKLAENPKYKKIQDALQSTTKAFSTQFKTRLYDVLTDEQWIQLQDLIDNPPEHAKVLLKKLREQRGETKKTGVWSPGPNSWQPGDPIPEAYRIERNERRNFPRPKQPSP